MNALPFYFMELGDRHKELGEKQTHLLSFCYRWLQPRAQQYLRTVLKECADLPHWEHSELLRRKLGVREIPSRQGHAPKEVSRPWIWRAYKLLSGAYAHAGKNVPELRRVLGALRSEEVARRAQAVLDAGGAPEFQAFLKIDLLLKQDLEEIAKGHPSPSVFAIETLASALGQSPESVKQQIKRAGRRLRQGRLV